jgi:two-component system NtrC family sensor kinase
MVNNAKHALATSDQKNRLINARIFKTNDGYFHVEVSDNGAGISEENITRIFNYGFTTKKNGHGFGLHSGALNAKEMGGSINVYSEGPGKGATFTLGLPFTPGPHQNG